MQLQYNIDITQLSAGLLKVHNAVVKEASRRKDAAGLLEAFRRDSEDSSKEQQNDLQVKLCIQLLSLFFKEQAALFFVDDEQDITQLTPCVYGVEEFNVKLDGVPLLTKPTISFRKAVEVCFASYWIFSMRYPVRLANTLLFVEKIILKRGGKAPAAVRKLGNRLMG